MVIVRLKGGLGNQLFQYAFARRLAEEGGQEVFLDPESGFKNDFFERAYSLKEFKISLKNAGKKELNDFNFYSGTLPGRMISKLKSITGFGRQYIKHEKNAYSFDESMTECRGNAYYDGYWQNPAYFEKYKEILVNEFDLIDAKKEKIKPIIEKIASEESIGVHIRRPHAINRGKIDPSTQSIYSVLDADYYKKALEIAQDKIPGGKVYVFAEDEEYAAKLLSGIKVDEIFHNEEHEDFYLFAQCRNQIIANSTFSWWGAWLNQNRDKLIISPAKWFKNENFDPRPLLKDFIKL